MISAGRLRHRIELQQKIATKDPATGAEIYAWQSVAKVWAAIEPLSAREYLIAQANQSEVSARIVIRYRPDVDATMRVVHGTDIYNISGVLADKDSGREYLTLPVSEGTNDG